MESIATIGVSVIDLKVGISQENSDCRKSGLFAGEHEEAHFHSIKGEFTLVLAVIQICSLSVLVDTNQYPVRSCR